MPRSNAVRKPRVAPRAAPRPRPPLVRDAADDPKRRVDDRVNAAGIGPRPPDAGRPGVPLDPIRAPNPNPTGLVPIVSAARSDQARAQDYGTAEEIARRVLPNANPAAQPSTEQPQSPLQTQTAPPLVGEYGTQDSLFGPGFTFSYYGERYTSDLLARNKGWQVYELMLRDDQVSASLLLAHSFITSRAWHFHADDTELQGEAVALLQYNFSRALHGTVRQLLDYLLSARIWGFALVEKIFDVLDWEGAPYWMLTGYKLRPSWTFTFQTDRNGNVLSIVQQQYSQRLQVPPDKFIHAVYQPEYDAQYGRSALIPIYDRWWEKKNVNKFWDVFLERCAAGVVVGTMPPGLDKQSVATLQNAIDRLQAQAGILMPAGGKIEFVMPHDTSAFEKRMENLNQAIARGLLLPSHVGLSQQGSTGSRAQGQAQIQTFMNVIDAWSAWAEDIINEQVILPLHTWNYGTDVPPPQFRFERLTGEQKQKMAEAITAAITSGVVQRTDEDEALVREKLGMAPRDYDEMLDVVSMPGEAPQDAQKRAQDQADGMGAAARNPTGEHPDPPEDVSVEGGGESPDENDPGSQQASPAEGAKNVLYGTTRWRLSIHDVQQRLDIGQSLLLLNKQDEQLGQALRDAAKKSFQALAGQVTRGAKPEDVRNSLEVPKKIVADAHKALVSALQTTYDHAATHAHLDVRRLGYKGADPGAAKGALGARGKHKLSLVSLEHLTLKGGGRLINLALDETTAAAWLEAHASELLDKLTQTQRAAFVQAWLQGIQNDWSEGEIVAQVQEALGGSVPDAWVETAVRTIDASAFNAARRAVFEDPELRGFVEGYEYTGVLDERTTELCEHMQTADGGGPIRLPVDSAVWDGLFPPNHFNCRSTVIPFTTMDGAIEWSDESLLDGWDAEKGF